MQQLYSVEINLKIKTSQRTINTKTFELIAAGDARSIHSQCQKLYKANNITVDVLDYKKIGYRYSVTKQPKGFSFGGTKFDGIKIINVSVLPNSRQFLFKTEDNKYDLNISFNVSDSEFDDMVEKLISTLRLT